MNRFIDQSRQVGAQRSFGAELPVEPQANKIRVVILQHPQEPDKELGTAVLLARCLENAELKIGLSWGSLSKALGQTADPARWGVLYLGAVKDMPELAPGGIVVLDKKGEPVEAELDGIIVLDGTWSQAKALWWRNAWILKLRRIILRPAKVSQYGRLRKEPRKDAVSTLEAVAETLRGLGEDPALCDYLEASFARMLSAYAGRSSGR